MYYVFLRTLTNFPIKNIDKEIMDWERRSQRTKKIKQNKHEKSSLQYLPVFDMKLIEYILLIWIHDFRMLSIAFKHA